MKKFYILLVAGLVAAASPLVAWARDGFTIFDAIRQAVTTHPGVGEATANRRATEAELRQTQSTLLPQVRVEGRLGRSKWDYKDNLVPPLGNNQNLPSREASVVVRQLLFDGLSSINDIWRQAARVDAAAYRVRERTELIALDAAEAYIDVVRYTRLLGLAAENVAAHRALMSNVQARFQGGRAGEGDLQQVRERVEAAIAAEALFRQQYDETRGTFRRAVGIEPHNLRGAARLSGLPKSRDQSLALALRRNPTILAAQSDRTAAKHAFDATAGLFSPTITFEGRALTGHNTGTTYGDRTDTSAMFVASWDIFRGGRDMWKRVEESERYQEQAMRHARLQRGAFESIDKAWAARTLTSDRIAALTRQIEADRKVIVAYQQEYELGQRSLIDLLNAQNQLFNAGVQLESTRGVAVFADYQLLAAMGELLDFVKTPRPVDSEPLATRPLGLIPTKFPPILFKPAGEPGSEPLNIGKKNSEALSTGVIRLTGKDATSIDQRWATSGSHTDPNVTAQGWLNLNSNKIAADDASAKASKDVQNEAPSPALSYAPVRTQSPSLFFPTISRMLQ
jgi:adhesin transport system outer membrane protein